MSNVKVLTRKTETSIEATAKRAARLIVDEAPAVVRRMFDTDEASGLTIKITFKPSGRTEAAKDPEVVITSKPDFGKETIKISARMTGEGDDAQLTLIQALDDSDLDTEADESEEADEAAAG